MKKMASIALLLGLFAIGCGGDKPAEKSTPPAMPKMQTPPVHSGTKPDTAKAPEGDKKDAAPEGDKKDAAPEGDAKKEDK